MHHTFCFTWFKEPTQVTFYETQEERWINGIGYRDEIICGECGDIIPLKRMYEVEVLQEEPNPVRILGDWVDFSGYIGDDWEYDENDFFV